MTWNAKTVELRTPIPRGSARVGATTVGRASIASSSVWCRQHRLLRRRLRQRRRQHRLLRRRQHRLLRRRQRRRQHASGARKRMLGYVARGAVYTKTLVAAWEVHAMTNIARHPLRRHRQRQRRRPHQCPAQLVLLRQVANVYAAKLRADVVSTGMHQETRAVALVLFTVGVPEGEFKGLLSASARRLIGCAVALCEEL